MLNIKTVRQWIRQLIRRYPLLRCAALAALLAFAAQISFTAIKRHKKENGHSITSGNNQNAIISNDSAASGKTLLASRSAIAPAFHFSRTGRNVAVLFSDRAISSFFPYILRQFPELRDKFSGFVYYPNTVSFGYTTHQAIGAVMGGYEYTMEAKNKRTGETNQAKYNESISVMPKLFLDAHFSVTISEIPDEEWRFNNDTYRRYKEIKTYYFGDRFIAPYLALRGDTYRTTGEKPDGIIKKRILGFCLMQTAPPLLRDLIYDDARYLQKKIETENLAALQEYAALYFLDALTDGEGKGGTFAFISCGLTHEGALMQEPDYIPNTGLDESNASCGYYEYKLPPSMAGGTKSDLLYYHVNAASMLLFTKWFDCLRSLGVYDNTRIIIVSDHGYDIPTPAFGESDDGKMHAYFNPLLMVKDFDAKGAVHEDNTFMTNADTLLIASKGLPVSGANPYTGRKFIDTVEKNKVHLYTRVGSDAPNETKTELIAGYSVSNNIFDERNWKPLKKRRRSS